MMRAAQFNVGGPGNISIGLVAKPVLREKEILIRVIATAINRADTLQRKGLYDPPAGESRLLGLEAAGYVYEKEASCTQWNIGDRVMALLAGGGNAEFVAVHEDLLMPVPNGMSFTSAAAIPETWLTAYQILHLIGNVTVKDVVLVHAGGSGVGTAAVQLIKLAGAKSIVTAGSQDKIDMAVSLGAEAGINYKEEKFGNRVKELTGGKGANLILDCISGSFCEENLLSIAFEGRWVLYGSLGGGDATAGFMKQILFKRLKLEGTTLRTRSIEYKGNLIKEFSAKALPFFENDFLKPIVDSVFPFGKLGEAHQRMEENKNTGKIIIQVQSEDCPISIQ